jgi:integrase
MSLLIKHLRDYLELRRGLGFELGPAESRRRNFIAFLKMKRTRQITTKLALEFALRSDHCSTSTQAGCLSAIRGFAQYPRGIEPKTEIPPTGLIRRGHRPQPYIYSDDEIIRILDAALQHPSTPRYALKPHTLYCLFGLLSVTGMRLTEALNLKPEDIDWTQGFLPSVVSVGEKRRPATTGTVDVPGACPHYRDVLVSDLYARANGSCGKTAGEEMERRQPCIRLIWALWSKLSLASG